jgi:Barstar (barnase inhibitor)
VTGPDAAATAKADAIRTIYAAVRAPAWAAPNLDALADVLRDLSWLPEGPVRFSWHPRATLPKGDRTSIEQVLVQAVRDSLDTGHPIQLDSIWPRPGG